jgi:hypothetical protein
MSEAAGEITGASSITRFARWYGPIALVIAVALLIVGQWPRAVGVALGAIPVLWFCRRFGKTFRGLRTRKSGSSGALVIGGTNAAMGALILFVGALIGGDFIVIVSTFFGTWMIATAAIVVTAFKSG